MIDKNILKTCHSEGYNEQDIYDAYKIFFGTLVSEPRLKIINLLRKGSKNVSEIVKEIGMDQTSVSHNLSRLKHCGFVKSERKGKFIYYNLNKKTIDPLMEIIDDHMSDNCLIILEENKNE